MHPQGAPAGEGYAGKKRSRAGVACGRKSPGRWAEQRGGEGGDGPHAPNRTCRAAACWAPSFCRCRRQRSQTVCCTAAASWRAPSSPSSCQSASRPSASDRAPCRHVPASREHCLRARATALSSATRVLDPHAASRCARPPRRRGRGAAAHPLLCVCGLCVPRARPRVATCKRRSCHVDAVFLGIEGAKLQSAPLAVQTQGARPCRARAG